MIMDLIPAPRCNLDNGFKYLGFFSKLNNYRVVDWEWIVKMIESIIFIWFNHLLSRRGRLVLLKSMLESIPVYWSSIVMIPKGIPSIIHKVNFQYLWLGKWNVGCIPLAWCLSSDAPKGLGGWGQNTIITFTQALVEHSLWGLVHNNSLWAWVLCSKYLPNY